MSRRTAETIAALAAVSLVAALPLAIALVPGRTLSWRDTAYLQAPIRSIVVPALRSFHLPLWNPLEGTGQTLLAQWIHAVLHPVTIATAVVGGGVDAWLLGFVAFAAAGAFAAALSLGASRAAAAGAAFAYALSGYVTGMTCNATFLAGAASAPWVVAGLRGAAERGGPSILLGGAAVACAAFAGDPGALVTSVLLGLALAAAAAGVRGAGRGVLGVALGVALAAIQLVPSWTYLRTMARGNAPPDPLDLVQWPLDPWRLVELLVPGFFVGRPASWQAPVYMALGSPSPFPLPWAPSVFVGIAVLLLAVVGAVRARDGRVLLASAAVFTWLALGHHLGAARLLSGVPLWGALRYAEKLVAPLTLALALGASLGADRLREVRWLTPVAVITACACAAVALASAAAPRIIAAALGISSGPMDAGRLASAHLAEGAVHAAVGAAALAALARFGPRLGRWLGPAACALLFAESTAALPFSVHLADRRVAQACPPAFPAAGPGPRLVTALVHNVTTSVGDMDPIEAVTAQFTRLGVPSLNVGCGIDSLEGYTGLQTARAQATIVGDDTRLALASRYGATHVLSEPPRGTDEARRLASVVAGGRLLAASADVGTWEIPHQPWVSFATSVRPVASLEDAIVALSDDLRRGGDTTVVESAAPLPAAPGRVLRADRRSEDIAVEAESGADALLVVRDAFHPGWTATLDGAPVAILAADVLVRAVRWPAGRHRLVMTYAPPEVRTGALVSIAAIAAALGICGVSFRRSRRVSTEASLPCA